jgi:restriction system protein
MAIPDFQTMMLPLLQSCRDGREHSRTELEQALVTHFSLTKDDLTEMLPSGRQGRFSNRVAWVKAELKIAGLIESPKQGVSKITERGLDLLKTNPASINRRLLSQFPEYVERLKSYKEKEKTKEVETTQSGTPEEEIESAIQNKRVALIHDLLDKLTTCSPRFFESLVVDVINKMGYGGTREDAAEVIGRSGDEGIDGIIKQDKLGLDRIYIQAKRWDPDRTVGRPEIHKFVGALTGQKANKGLFITTTKFTADAISYVSSIVPKIVLIDGEMLAKLMFDHNIGVSTVATYELKRIDSDYFTEE